MSLTIIKAGLLDTVQDHGRYGYQHLGINPGGAMDAFAAALANVLLGKELSAPVIEIHFPAAQILFQKPAVICLTGADFMPAINGEPVPVCQPIAVAENSLLTCKGRRSGARAYLSVFNHLQLTPWLASYSTNLKAAAGGLAGRRLQKGDSIPFSPITLPLQNSFSLLPWRYPATTERSTDVAFLPGPEWHWLTVKSQTDLLNNQFVITPASDRMGYRLQGEKLEVIVQEQLVSSAVNFGTVQLLPNGQLIVLMADHQTTGGYPRVATVISTDRATLAQRNAGEEIRFVMTTIGEAEAQLVQQQNYLRQLQNTCNLKIKNWLDAHRY